MMMRILKPFNGNTMKIYVAIVVAGLSVFGMVAVVNLVTIKFFDQGIEVTGDRNKIIYSPRELAEMQPIDLCKEAEEVTVSQSSVGNFYRASLGVYTLSWTEPLAKVAFTDGTSTIWPEAEQNVKDCLRNHKKLKAVRPE